MMFGPFPPSSRSGRFRFVAASRMICWPTSTEPVKQILSTPGWRASAAPAIEPPDVGDRVTGILRLQPGDQFSLVLDEAREPQEELPAFLGGQSAPRAFERGSGGGDRVLNVVLAGLRDLREDFVVVGIVDWKGGAGVGGDELAADEEAVSGDVRHDRYEAQGR